MSYTKDGLAGLPGWMKNIHALRFAVAVAPDREKLANVTKLKQSYVSRQLSIMRRIANGKEKHRLTDTEVDMCRMMSDLYPSLAGRPAKEIWKSKRKRDLERIPELHAVLKSAHAARSIAQQRATSDAPPEVDVEAIKLQMDA